MVAWLSIAAARSLVGHKGGRCSVGRNFMARRKAEVGREAEGGREGRGYVGGSGQVLPYRG